MQELFHRTADLSPAHGNCNGLHTALNSEFRFNFMLGFIRIYHRKIKADQTFLHFRGTVGLTSQPVIEPVIAFLDFLSFQLKHSLSCLPLQFRRVLYRNHLKPFHVFFPYQISPVKKKVPFPHAFNSFQAFQQFKTVFHIIPDTYNFSPEASAYRRNHMFFKEQIRGILIFHTIYNSSQYSPGVNLQHTNGKIFIRRRIFQKAAHIFSLFRIITSQPDRTDGYRIIQRKPVFLLCHKMKSSVRVDLSVQTSPENIFYRKCRCYCLFIFQFFLYTENCFLQLPLFQGFQNIIVNAQFNSLSGFIKICIRGQHNYPARSSLAAKLLQHSHSAHSGQLNIHDHQIRTRFTDQLISFSSI